MKPYLNALLLKFDGDEDGADAPSKGQVATTWAAAASLLFLILR